MVAITATDVLATPTKKLPKAVVDCRDILKQASIRLEGLSGDAIESAMPTKQMNVLSNAFRATLTTDQKTDYKNLENDNARMVGSICIGPRILSPHGIQQGGGSQVRKLRKQGNGCSSRSWQDRNS